MTKTHKMHGTRIHSVWSNMKARCQIRSSISYKNYGGRGIKVCDQWQRFEGFRDDMYDSYLKHVEEYGTDNTQIDRIDNNGNYEPENCKWVTRKINSLNRRDNNRVTFNGETKTILEWSDEVGLKYQTLRNRIHLHNWSVEEALTIPFRKHKEVYKRDNSIFITE